MTENDFSTTDENRKDLNGMEEKEYKITTKACPFCGEKAAGYIDWEMHIDDNSVREIAEAKGINLEEADDFTVDEVAREAFAKALEEVEGLTYARKAHIYCTNPKCGATITGYFHPVNSATTDEEAVRELIKKWNKDWWAGGQNESDKH